MNKMNALPDEPVKIYPVGDLVDGGLTGIISNGNRGGSESVYEEAGSGSKMTIFIG